MKLEEKLVSLRKAKGLSQLKLAEMMNVSRQAISRWEVGTAVPSTDNLKYLGRLYNVPLDYLLHDDAPDLNEIAAADLTEKSGTRVPRKTMRRKILIIIALIVLLVLSVGMIFCIYIHKNQEAVPIEELTDDADWGSSEADEFSLDW